MIPEVKGSGDGIVIARGAPERSDNKVSLMQLEFSLSRGKKKPLSINVKVSIIRREKEERERQQIVDRKSR